MSKIAELYKKAEKERKEREERERREEEKRQARQRADECAKVERQRREAEEQKRKSALYEKEKKEKRARLLERSGLQKILDELKNELGMEIVTFTHDESLGPEGFAIGQVIHYDYEEAIKKYSSGGDPNKGTCYHRSIIIGTAYYTATGIIGVRVEIRPDAQEITVCDGYPHQSFTPENNWKGLAESVVKNLELGIAQRKVVRELRRRRKILGLF